jgi:hypothetical protein
VTGAGGLFGGGGGGSGSGTASATGGNGQSGRALIRWGANAKYPAVATNIDPANAKVNL